MAMSSGSATAVGVAAGPSKAPSEKQQYAYLQLLGKGFGLAYALVRDRQMALEIATSAMSKLRAQRSRERKRSYWREKSLKRKITRLIRAEEDMLQWLVYLESTHYEQQQESRGGLGTSNMVLRYIKALVQFTTAMSSFYVGVGLQRLLYNYRTPEAQRTYERLTDLYPNAEAYRATKATLMNQMKKRFGDALKICEGARGERRFEIMEQQERWFGFVEQCLELFVPWSTRRACLTSGFDGVLAGDAPAGKEYRRMRADALEIQWCHAFIHPPCLVELTKKVELELPGQRLAIPQFYNAMNKDDNSDDFGGDNQKLSEDELKGVMKRFHEEDLQRQGASPKTLRIVADGTECGKIDVAGPASKFQCELAEGTKLLEVRADLNGRDILLGTHWIEYTKWEGVAPVLASLSLPHDRQLELNIKPIGQTEPGQRRISLQLQCRPVSRLIAWKESLRAVSGSRSYVLPKYALASAILLAIGWVLGARWNHRYFVEQEATIQQIRKEFISEQQARRSIEDRLQAGQAVVYDLIPDELRHRGPQGIEADIVRMSAQSRSVILKLPVGVTQNASYRVVLKAFLNREELLIEAGLTPQPKAGEMVVDVEVPSILLQNEGQYVLDLYSRGSSKAWTKIHAFRFRAVKH
jgi:hypothetical protein